MTGACFSGLPPSRLVGKEGGRALREGGGALRLLRLPRLLRPPPSITN